VGITMQPRYQIHLYHDGTQYVAAVPELDGCSGTGQSYAEALASSEKAMASWVFAAINCGKTPPEPAKDFVLRPPTRPPAKGAGAVVLRRLHARFGNLNSRQLMEKMGIEGVSTSIFSGSVAGLGKRFVRCAIAMHLEDMPSKLWPDRSLTSRERDDACMPSQEETAT